MKTIEERFMKKCLKKVEAKGWELRTKGDMSFDLAGSDNHSKAYKLALKVARKLAEKHVVTLDEDKADEVIRLNGSSVYISGTFYCY